VLPRAKLTGPQVEELRKFLHGFLSFTWEKFPPDGPPDCRVELSSDFQIACLGSALPRGRFRPFPMLLDQIDQAIHRFALGNLNLMGVLRRRGCILPGAPPHTRSRHQPFLLVHHDAAQDRNLDTLEMRGRALIRAVTVCRLEGSAHKTDQRHVNRF